MTLGKRIADNRKKSGLTQEQLAEKLGLTAQAVSKWENDQSCPDITVLPKLAEIFGITTDALLGREAPPKVHEAEVVDDGNGTGFVEIHDEDDRWVFQWDGGKKSATLFALMVLLVGGLTLLSRLYCWDASFWDILWPCGLLFVGIAGMRRFSVFHLGLIIFSAYSLVANLGLWKLDIAQELIFPICVVLFGLGLLIDALKKPNKPRFHIVHRGDKTSEKFRSDCHTEDGRFDCSVSFGEINYTVKAEELTGGCANISFGELTLDLSGCQAVAQDCCIEGNCSFGSLRLLVPRQFRVEINNSTAFASVDVKGHPAEAPAGVIQLDANVSFGEIEIRYL